MPGWRPADFVWRGSNWLPPRELPLDEWAEANIVLPRAMTASPGPLDLDRTPYLREILRATQDPAVEEITLCFATQLAKTTACLVIALHSLAEDPWPILHVMPREDDAVTINCDRYQKMILESPGLRRHLTGAKHDMTRERIRINGGSIDFASANSPAGLASRAIAKLFLDETDKYPRFSGQEANPIALARERTQTFFDRLILKTSTPTTERGYIWQEYFASDRRRYFVPCPLCGQYQVLTMGVGESSGIRWPKDVPIESIVDDRLAWYECESCRGRILDDHKPGMLRRGVWVPEGARVGMDGSVSDLPVSCRKTGYWLSALYSPWRTFSQVAVEFLRSKDYPDLLMNFRNSWLAEVWHDRVEELHDEHLRVRRGHYHMGEVPPGVQFLTAGVDVQVDHLWYVIRGWGSLGESWLIRAGRVETLEALYVVLFGSTYIKEGGEPVRLVRAAVDAAYRGDEIYDFCRRVPAATAVRGDARSVRDWPSRPATHTGPDGHVHELVMLNTRYWKCKIHRHIRLRDEDPGAWHLPADVPEPYFDHLTGEQQVRHEDKRTGQVDYLWQLVRPGAPNHLFDCEVYAMAATESFSLEHREDASGGAFSALPFAQPSNDRPRFTKLPSPARRYFRNESKAYETTSESHGCIRKSPRYCCRIARPRRVAVA